MRRTRTSIVAIAAVLVFQQHGIVLAATRAAPDPQGWMPDVAGRIEQLRERTQQAAAEARERELRDRQGGQWWRLVAVAPRAAREAATLRPSAPAQSAALTESHR